MDRHISSSLGVPMSTSDSDITALSSNSNTGSRDDIILSLQAKLWHLLSAIFTSECAHSAASKSAGAKFSTAVYKTSRTELGAFLGVTRSILHALAGYALEIEEMINVKFNNSVETMSRGTRHITLLYHQVHWPENLNSDSFTNSAI
jgi:proline utilization trans-activator